MGSGLGELNYEGKWLGEGSWESECAREVEVSGR